MLVVEGGSAPLQCHVDKSLVVDELHVLLKVTSKVIPVKNVFFSRMKIDVDDDVSHAQYNSSPPAAVSKQRV
jgi:hypothetical protein